MHGPIDPVLFDLHKERARRLRGEAMADAFRRLAALFRRRRPASLVPAAVPRLACR